MGDNTIGPQGFLDLAEALTLNQTLRFLEAGNNQPGDSGVVRMAAVLCDNIALEGLDIHSCCVSDIGIEALAEVLSHNQTLTGLNLDCNKISDNGLTALAEGLRKKVSVLRHLDLQGNLFGEEGKAVVADALRFNCCLQELYGIDLFPFASTVFRLTASAMKRWNLLQREEGEEGDDVGNMRLLRAVRAERRGLSRRIEHELGKEVHWKEEDT